MIDSDSDMVVIDSMNEILILIRSSYLCSNYEEMDAGWSSTTLHRLYTMYLVTY